MPPPCHANAITVANDADAKSYSYSASSPPISVASSVETVEPPLPALPSPLSDALPLVPLHPRLQLRSHSPTPYPLPLRHAPVPYALGPNHHALPRAPIRLAFPFKGAGAMTVAEPYFSHNSHVPQPPQRALPYSYAGGCSSLHLPVPPRSLSAISYASPSVSADPSPASSPGRSSASRATGSSHIALLSSTSASSHAISHADLPTASPLPLPLHACAAVSILPSASPVLSAVSSVSTPFVASLLDFSDATASASFLPAPSPSRSTDEVVSAHRHANADSARPYSGLLFSAPPNAPSAAEPPASSPAKAPPSSPSDAREPLLPGTHSAPAHCAPSTPSRGFGLGLALSVSSPLLDVAAAPAAASAAPPSLEALSCCWDSDVGPEASLEATRPTAAGHPSDVGVLSTEWAGSVLQRLCFGDFASNSSQLHHRISTSIRFAFLQVR